MGLWLDNYYMMEKPLPHDDIPSTFEMLEISMRILQKKLVLR